MIKKSINVLQMMIRLQFHIMQFVMFDLCHASVIMKFLYSSNTLLILLRGLNNTIWFDSFIFLLTVYHNV